MPPILVGIDGSEFSMRALQWAVEEAKLRDAALHVVTAFQSHEDYFFTAEGLSLVGAPQLEEWAAAARGEAERLLSDTVARSDAEGAGLEVEREVVSGPAVPALVERSKDADLLVLGSRGRGGLRELLLGSVSHQCAQHAHCPVVIIPAGLGEGAGG